MYYSDLTQYDYLGGEVVQPGAALLNVGWLDAAYPYASGSVSSEFLWALWRLCASPVNPTRGFHHCTFCLQSGRISKFSGMMLVTSPWGELCLGSAEMRVSGQRGVTYAAPDLIYHYVAEHEYRPPDEFVAAVIRAGDELRN